MTIPCKRRRLWGSGRLARRVKGQERQGVSGPRRAICASSARKPLSLQSLPQPLCLVAPSLVAFSTPEHKAKHGKRGDRDECDNPTHLHPPNGVWVVDANAGLLINCLESWLTATAGCQRPEAPSPRCPLLNSTRGGFQSSQARVIASLSAAAAGGWRTKPPTGHTLRRVRPAGPMTYRCAGASGPEPSSS
jgi:hypothetical protein